MTTPLLEAYLENQAAAFFFQNYVFSRRMTGESVFQFLPAMYTQASESSPLPHVICAIGFAGLASQYATPKLMTIASARYHGALRLMNQVLQDPLKAVEDAILASVSLLSLYEVRCYS